MPYEECQSITKPLVADPVPDGTASVPSAIGPFAGAGNAAVAQAVSRSARPRPPDIPRNAAPADPVIDEGIAAGLRAAVLARSRTAEIPRRDDSSPRRFADQRGRVSRRKIQRQDGPGGPAADPVHVPYPGAGRLSFFPGPGPLRLAGTQLPLPGSLRLTNALGMGAGPTFVADLDPRMLVVNLLGSVDLQTSPAAGTAPSGEGDAANQSRLSLEQARAQLDFSSGAINGSATLHIPSSYPPALHPGTDVGVQVSSNVTSPWRWQVGANYGPMTANATIRLHYDLGRLATAATSGIGEVGQELRAPGVSADGTVRAFGVPVTGFGLEAATTRPRQQPLLGAPTPFPSTLWAGGAIIAPPGAITDTAVPALGFTRSSFGERSGTSMTAAAVPTISAPDISAGAPLGQMFPVRAFAEVAYVNRVSDGLELGLRIVLQVNTAELLSKPPLPQFDPHQRAAADDPSGRAAPQMVTPQLGATIFGRFNAF